VDINPKGYTKPSIQLPLVPSHSIFGKPEDPIQNVKYPTPKSIKKDQIKLVENDDRVLR